MQLKKRCASISTIWTVCLCIFLCLSLNACNNDASTSKQDSGTIQEDSVRQPTAADAKKDTPPAPQEDAASTQIEKHTIPAQLQNGLQLMPVISQVSVNLELLPAHLESLRLQKQNLLLHPRPQKLMPGKKENKSLKIGAGILTDPDARNLSESVAGAEVKLDLKWN
ncbi:MAG: hypothetical protein LC645_04010 [Geobacteraceae bacterium]|nr:hypothetical protein [Geobacteraceae bacterium]